MNLSDGGMDAASLCVCSMSQYNTVVALLSALMDSKRVMKKHWLLQCHNAKEAEGREHLVTQGLLR